MKKRPKPLIKMDRPLTTFEVSRACGVVHSTVSKWIDEGKLIAYRTPGGHRRIRPPDLITFLKNYDMPVPEELVQFLSDQNGEKETKKKKILIVEDDQTLQQSIVERLKQLDPEIELHTAGDGYEAGKQIASLFPDLILLDLILPGVDGFKILREIRKDDQYTDTKIVVVSGYDSIQNRMKVVSAGDVDGFFTKPLDLIQMCTQVIALLKGSETAHE